VIRLPGRMVRIQRYNAQLTGLVGETMADEAQPSVRVWLQCPAHGLSR